MGCTASRPEVHGTQSTTASKFKVAMPGSSGNLDAPRPNLKEADWGTIPSSKAHGTTQSPRRISIKSGIDEGNRTREEDNGKMESASLAPLENSQSGKKTKGRRQGFGDKRIKDQIKQLVGDQSEPLDNVSDSDDDMEGKLLLPTSLSKGESSRSSAGPPADVFDTICEELSKTFVFKGIRTPLLSKVVSHMFKCEYKAGDSIIQQGSAPGKDDCLFYVQSGDVDVVIAGGSEETYQDDIDVSKMGNTTVIRKGEGWTFGNLTLLFNSPRTASVIAASSATLWAMDKRTFLEFVLTHAPGARAVRFLRKLPLLKGVPDNVLVDIAERLKEEVYSDGEHLIQAGDRADGLYVIRYGNVQVKIGDKQIATLGRGQFVGERTLVTGKLRSADCVASGKVTAIVMQKRDFLEVNNPLLDWMIPYDAARAVLKPQPEMKDMAVLKFESIIDAFGGKTEQPQGTVLFQQGEIIDRLLVFITGEVELIDAGGAVVPHSGEKVGCFQEEGGFSSYGTCCLSTLKPSPYTVTVRSKTATFVTLMRKAVDDALGVAANSALTMSDSDRLFAKSVLHQSHMLSIVSDDQMDQLVARMKVQQCSVGQIITQMGTLANYVHILKHGECIVAQTQVDGDTTLQQLRSVGHAFMCHGDFYGEIMLVKRQQYPASVVSVQQGTVILTLSITDVVEVLGVADDQEASKELVKLALTNKERDKNSKKLDFQSLTFHRIVGTGQFGAVRLVTRKNQNDVFALKILHKGPITEGKQVEHIINELTVMEECKHPFCVQLKGAYQDQDCLYLLQEWVPGGELFHHLDLRGSFDEATAQFYAANVLTALEYLHSKGIIYRDLKPENLLLDAQGYAKVADFGFAKHVGKSRTFTICGTPDYQAPEVIMRRGTTKAVDYWALGVLIFEMLVGDPPFMSTTGDPWDTFRRSMTGRCQVPSFVSSHAADLIYKLLQVNPERRLGTNGTRDIRKHPWFARMDWQLLEAKKLKAPIVPKLSNPTDTSNFDSFESQVTSPPVNTRNDRNIWQLWEWVDTTGLPINGNHTAK